MTALLRDIARFILTVALIGLAVHLGQAIIAGLVAAEYGVTT